MGVKDLWTILAPVKCEKSLEELAGKRLAVDLSGWVCQADTTKALAGAVKKPYLRNLFFRILRLYGEGVSLVMVVDGEATQLKWSTMDQRENPSHGKGGACYHRNRQTGRRTQLNSKINECVELLDALGVPYLHSQGEAEALCGLLSQNGLVDGVLTQDSDTFLYGATVVYKDLSTNEKESHVDCYCLEDIKSKLGLDRKDMVSLALLLGCDYCPQGVPNVGKEGAMKLIATCKSYDRSCDMLDLLRGWKDGTKREDVSKTELQIKRKAIAVPGFPSEAIIDEYLIPKDRLPSHTHKVLSWQFPHVLSAQVVCHRLLEWSFEYTHKKVLSLVTQWCLRREGVTKGAESQGPVTPLRISHQRKRQGVHYFEVEWKASGSTTALLTEETVCLAASHSLADGEPVHFTTLERVEQFTSVYPSLCTAFEEQKKQQRKKSKSSKGKRMASPSHHDSQSSDELSTALSELKLKSHEHHMTKMKVEPALRLCDDSQKHTITSSQTEVKTSKSGGQKVSSDDVLSTAKPTDESECIDEFLPPLAEMIRSNKASTLLDHQRSRLTHGNCDDCDEIPSLAERLKAKSWINSNSSSVPVDSLRPSALHGDHNGADVMIFKRTQELDRTSSVTVGQSRVSGEKQIVISDSSSESETEDPLIGHGDTEASGAERVMSSLRHQYCADSSEDGSSTDDDVPPLVKRIGSKRPGNASSPLKSKLSPTRDLRVVTDGKATQIPATCTLTKSKRKLRNESSKVELKDIVVIDDVDSGSVGEIPSGKCASLGVPETGLSGTCCIGSAEFPIQID